MEILRILHERSMLPHYFPNSCRDMWDDLYHDMVEDRVGLYRIGGNGVCIGHAALTITEDSLFIDCAEGIGLLTSDMMDTLSRFTRTVCRRNKVTCVVGSPRLQNCLRRFGFVNDGNLMVKEV